MADAGLSLEERENIKYWLAVGTVESHVDRILKAPIERSDIKKSRLSSALLKP